MLDFLALEEAQATVHLVGDAHREQRMLEHARLRVAAVEHGDFAAHAAVVDQRADLVDQPLRLHAVGGLLDDAHRLALALFGPEVLAQASGVVPDEGIGRIQDVAVRAVVLFQADDTAMCVIAFEVGHVADVGAAKRIDGLIVVADRENRRPGARQQTQPLVLQRVGVLELIDQDMAEAPLVMLSHRRVARQQLVRAQQQLGEIDHALALALRLVQLVDLDQLAPVRIVGLDVAGTQPLFLGAVDETLHIARRVLLVVDIARLEQALDGGQLVGGIENLECLRQARVAMVRAQHAVAQAVEGTDPQATRVDRQQGRHAREHFTRRLVGKGDCQQRKWTGLAGLNQPGHPGRQYAGLAAARPGENQGVLRFERYCSALFRIELFQHHAA
ncbi:Uncharacterised protein [Bordetella pertussis]|nr:Uncharacterised protein [Bordetella pertussis]